MINCILFLRVLKGLFSEQILTTSCICAVLDHLEIIVMLIDLIELTV